MSETCVFCGIVAGTEPATMIREWDDAIAFVPLNPVVDGHTLVVPRAHVPNAVTAPDVTAATMRYACALAAESASSNILTSIGKPATQSIFHLHIHMIPRKTGDWLMVPWGTAGDPHAPHWCARLAAARTGLLAEIDDMDPDHTMRDAMQDHTRDVDPAHPGNSWWRAYCEVGGMMRALACVDKEHQ